MSSGPINAAALAFSYPHVPHKRKHGPSGYKSYQQYRDWLRDEFWFRCPVCLFRKRWAVGPEAIFHIDHIKPHASSPTLHLDYDNLIYVCARCNLLKGCCDLVDPSVAATHNSLRISADGSVEALNDEGRILVSVYRLNAPTAIEYRAKMLRVLQTLQPSDLSAWVGFPSNMPDLRTKHPPHNSRPNGVNDCCFVLREQGRLPEVY